MVTMRQEGTGPEYERLNVGICIPSKALARILKHCGTDNNGRDQTQAQATLRLKTASA